MAMFVACWSGRCREYVATVMAGLDPAIHFSVSAQKVVDARIKPGHDEQYRSR